MKGIEGHYKTKVRYSPDKTEMDRGHWLISDKKAFTPAVQLNLQELPEFWELCLQ